MNHQPTHSDPAEMPGPARPHVRPRRISPIWLIPLIAAGVAGYLVWHTLSQRGPVVTITFDSGEGIVPGQTKVQHKAVTLGTVKSLRLSPDMRSVEVAVQMDKGTGGYLTDHAKFWVVRARFTAGQVSGLETLVSGSYIDFDPGAPGGREMDHFNGLEEPPAVRSDEPGRSYTLLTDQVGSLSTGSPVFYRSVAVGEVLGHNQPAPNQPMSVRVFVRAPYDQYIRPGTHFWNASGVSVKVGAGGVRLQMESLRAVLAGGVAFDTPGSASAEKPAPADTTFHLYPDAATAAEAGSGARIPFVSYFNSSVSGLAKGASVEVYGIPVGTVTDVGLHVNDQSGAAQVRVGFQVDLDRLFPNGGAPQGTPAQIAATLVQRGMRVELGTSNYLTGQQVLTLQFPSGPGGPGMVTPGTVTPGTGSTTGAAARPSHARFDAAAPPRLLWLAAATPAEVPAIQGAPSSSPPAPSPAQPAPAPTPAPTGPAAPSAGQQPVVLPSEAGTLQNITESLSRIVAKLDQLPLAEIGQHLNQTLTTLDQTLAGPELQQTLRNLNQTTAAARDLVRRTNASLTPFLNRLPALTDEVQGTVGHANKLLGSLDSTYGNGSDTNAELQRLLWQANETLRSIRLLADFLSRHPEALVTGRAGGNGK